jgi:hypothetical protein
MILNENVEFATVADDKTRRAFIGGGPELKVRLFARKKLYKWTQFPLIGPNGISAWWSFVIGRTFPGGIRVAGLRNLEERSQRLGQHPRDFARVQFAVTKHFNLMTNLLLVELTQDAYGFVGKTFGQLEDKAEPKVYLIGGERQLWLPNLTPSYVREVPAIG